MAFPIEEFRIDSTDKISLESVRVIDGRYLTFAKELPITKADLRPLITPGRELEIVGYELLGCRYPSVEAKEPGSDTIETDIANVLTSYPSTTSNLHFIHRTNSTQKEVVATKLFPSTNVTKFRFINGYIYDNGEQIATPEAGWYPVSEKYPDYTYFITNAEDGTPTIHLITVETEELDIGGTKFRQYRSVETISITKPEIDTLIGKGNILNNERILLQENTPGSMDFTDVKDNSTYQKDRLVTVDIAYQLKLNIYAGFIKTGTSSTVDSEYGDATTTINYELLNRGHAYFLDNLGRTEKGRIKITTDPSKITDPTEKADYEKQQENEQFFSKLREANVSAIKGTTEDGPRGIWENSFWQDTIRNDYPVRTSYSSLRTFMGCPYRYFRAAIDNPKYANTDKDDMLIGAKFDTGKAILGTILHYNAAYFYRAASSGGDISEIRKQYESQTINHWFGRNIEGINDYRFNLEGISAIPNKYKQEGLKEIKEIFDILEERTILKSGDKFFAEVEVDDIYSVRNKEADFIIKNFDIIGYIDGSISRNTGTLEEELIIFDVKSSVIKNKLQGTRYNRKFLPTWELPSISKAQLTAAKNEIILAFDENRDPDPSNGGLTDIQIGEINANPGTQDRAQIVWYLYWLIREGKIGTTVIDIIKPNTELTLADEDIIDVMNKDNVKTFYDMIRYDDGGTEPDFDNLDNNGFAFQVIPPDERIIIWWYFIKPLLERVADKLSVYESRTLTVNEIKEFAQPVQNQHNCEYCSYRKTCPAHYQSIQDEILNDAPGTSGPSYAILGKPQGGRDFEDVHSPEIKEYINMSKGISKTIERLNEESKIQLNKRRKALRNIEAEYDTQIGSIYLSSAITSITTKDIKRHQFNDTLRTPFPSVFRTESSDKQVQMTIRFNSAEKINSELRHIIAQFYTFPFISIKNRELTRIMLPFDSNKDVYWSIADEKTMRLVRKYLKAKGGSDELDYVAKKDSPGETKNEIYSKTRLFYSLQGLVISAVANEVDTVDLTLSLQLVDTVSISTRGIIEYLTDTHAVLMQHAWLYNSNVERITDTSSNDLVTRLIAVKTASAENPTASIANWNAARMIEITVGKYGKDRVRSTDTGVELEMTSMSSILNFSSATQSGHVVSHGLRRLLACVYENIKTDGEKAPADYESKCLITGEYIIPNNEVGFIINPSPTYIGQDSLKSKLSRSSLMFGSIHLSKRVFPKPYRATAYFGLENVNVDIPIFNFYTYGYMQSHQEWDELPGYRKIMGAISEYSISGSLDDWEAGSGNSSSSNSSQINPLSCSAISHILNPIMTTIDTTILNKNMSAGFFDGKRSINAESIIRDGKIHPLAVTTSQASIDGLAYGRLDGSVMWASLYRSPSTYRSENDPGDMLFLDTFEKEDNNVTGFTAGRVSVTVDTGVFSAIKSWFTNNNKYMHISESLKENATGIMTNQYILNLDKYYVAPPSKKDKANKIIPLMYDEELSKIIEGSLNATLIVSQKGISAFESLPKAQTYDITIHKISFKSLTGSKRSDRGLTRYPDKYIRYTLGTGANKRRIGIESNYLTLAPSPSKLYEAPFKGQPTVPPVFPQVRTAYVATIIAKKTGSSVIRCMSFPLLATDLKTFSTTDEDKETFTVSNKTLQYILNIGGQELLTNLQSVPISSYWVSAELSFIDDYYDTIQRLMVTNLKI